MLNSALDPASFAQRYREKLRLQIHGILDAATAHRLHQCLTTETPWGLTYSDEKGQAVRLSAEEVRAMPEAVRAKITSDAQARAKDGFQYVYQVYPMISAYLEKRDPDLFLHRVLEGINTPAFLGFIRQVTGIPTIVKADAQATLYAPGDFLRRHNDPLGPRRNRRVAYIISMTKDWHPDYGAMLQFYDDDNAVTDVFVPRFNTISLFTVPQMHAVSFTAPFAPLARYSITGWFQDPDR